MALLARRDDKPISEMTDKELRKRLGRAEKIIGNLPPPTASAEEREKALGRARAAAAELPALRTEMKSRERFARHREIETEVLRGGLQRGREVVTPGVIEGFQRLGQDVGLKLDPMRLDGAERSAALKLWSRLHAGDGSPEERTDFEALAEKAAGKQPGFFDERRKKAQMEKQLAELKEEAHVQLLPRRPRYEEPGAVTLPRSIFAQLQTAKSGHWSVADIGCLAVVLSCFEEKRTLIRDSAFEEQDGEVVLVARGPISRLSFERRVNPHVEYSVASTGWIDLPASLARLSAAAWVDIREIPGGRVELRLGERARKLLER